MDVVDELVAEVKAARRIKAALKRREDRIIELMIQARLQDPDLGPGDLEETIGRYYERATISRKTAPFLGDRRSRRRSPKTPNSPDAPTGAGES